MTTPADPSRPAAPSVREIAALTARLRAITARGRAVDPDERARFLADKDALISRITDADRRRAAVRKRYDPQNAIADAVRTGAEHPDYVLGDRRDAVEMPEWMRENARATESQIAAGTYEAGAPDDMERIAARLAELRDTATDHDAQDHAAALIEGPLVTAAELAARDTEFDALTERYPLPGDPGGDWIELGPRGEPQIVEAGPVDDDWWTEQDQHPRTRDAGDDGWDDAGTDGAEPAGRDDPTWWAPTGPDEVALTHREVAAELGERGFTPEQARAAISDYLDETSQRIGLPVHQWAMDSHDVESIAHTHHPPVPVPEQRHPRPAQHTATAHPTPARGDGPPVDAEDERREQLVRWHTDDTTAGPGRGDGLGEGRADSGGDVADVDAVIVEGGRS